MSTAARRDVFQAIADPTRRQIISLLAGQPMNLNTIADNFEVSRSAVSQQIKILEECGMIVIRKEGRERFCEAKLEALSEVWLWAEQYRQSWNEKFDSLDRYLARVQKKQKQKTKK